MSLGIKLRNMRYAKKMSQAEIANLLDISQPAYHLWETDQAKPSIDNLLKISEVYKTDIYSLLDEKSPNFINNNPTLNDSSSIQQQYCPTINNSIGEDLLQFITANQEYLKKMIENQNKLIDNFLNKTD